MSILLWQCTPDELSPVITLRKGLRVSDAALETFDQGQLTSTLITSSSWEDKLVNNNNKEQIRPSKIADYQPYISDLKKFKIIKSGPTYSFPDLILDWKEVSTYQIIAIFKQNIEVSWLKNKILNEEDIVWIGYPTPMSNKLNFREGKIVEYNKNTQELVSRIEPPKIQDLNPGIYVWCVWAYKEDGKRIVASSREIPFSISY